MLDACLMVHGSWLKAHGSWPREARGGSWLMGRGQPGPGDPKARGAMSHEPSSMHQASSIKHQLKILFSHSDPEAQPWGGPKADISETFRSTFRGCGGRAPTTHPQGRISGLPKGSPVNGPSFGVLQGMGSKKLKNPDSH